MKHPKASLRVYVITFCRKLELLYGTTLVFSSLRTGFPTAEIMVIDNGSLKEARPAIRQATEEAGGQFVPIREQAHHNLLQWLICQSNRPIAIIDPDIYFWGNMERVAEQMGPGKLIAGRLIPAFNDPYTGCLTVSRIHTSCLVIPDPALLSERIRQIARLKFDWNPFSPVMVPVNGSWIRLDTLAGLMCCPENIQPFSEEELDCYDHLFCGSHIDLIAERMPDSIAKRQFLDLHKLVQKDSAALRGARHLQEEIFRQLAIGRELKSAA